MFANITPFKIAEQERKAAQLKTAADKLYATLTERFKTNADKIKAEMQEAIRTAKCRRDYRVSIAFYNSVQWAQPYAEIDVTAKWAVEDNEWDTRIKTDSADVSVHRIMRSPGFLARLGIFFGDHFTVSVQAGKVYTANTDYTAVEQVIYLNYWVDPIRPGPGCVEEPPSPIEVDTTLPFCRVENGVPVWYNMSSE